VDKTCYLIAVLCLIWTALVGIGLGILYYNRRYFLRDKPTDPLTHISQANRGSPD